MVVVWLCGCCVVVWLLCGCVVVWLCGCVVVAWLCGCCVVVFIEQSNDYDKKGCEKSTEGTTQLIRAAYDRNKSVLIAVDFNYKEIDWEMEYAPHHDSHLQDFVETLQDCFLSQHVTEPERVRGQICWIWFYQQMRIWYRILPIILHWGKAIT